MVAFDDIDKKESDIQTDRNIVRHRDRIKRQETGTEKGRKKMMKKKRTAKSHVKLEKNPDVHADDTVNSA